MAGFAAPVGTAGSTMIRGTQFGTNWSSTGSPAARSSTVAPLSAKIAFCRSGGCVASIGTSTQPAIAQARMITGDTAVFGTRQVTMAPALVLRSAAPPNHGRGP